MFIYIVEIIFYMIKVSQENNKELKNAVLL